MTRWTHVLLVVTFVVCLFFHPPPNYPYQLPGGANVTQLPCIWMVVPFGIYMLDRLVRLLWRSFLRPMELHAAHILPPGDVICLMMKPKGNKRFKFKPGEWCFVHIE